MKSIKLYKNIFLLLILTSVSFSHPEDPKGRWHNRLGEGFSSSLDMDGDLIVVGETNGGIVSGAVYVYSFNTSDNEWEMDTLLMASDAVAGDGFGKSIALNGNTLMVGKFDNAEAVYVFDRDPETGLWTQTQKITMTSQVASDFGYRIALTDDYAVITARKAVGSEGRAYVYEKMGVSGLWTEMATLDGSTISSSDEFGKSVAAFDDYAIVGTNYGESAFLFKRNSSNSWSQIDVLNPSSGSGRFGYAVAIDDGYALVGMVTANGGRGRVISFAYTDAGAYQTDIISAGEQEASEFFGVAIAMDDNRAIIGKYNGTSVYLETRSGNTWSQTTVITGSDTEGSHRFGRQVALDGSRALVGAYYNESAYVFDESGSSWTQTQKLTAESRVVSITGDEKECTDGRAGPFPCDNVKLLSYLIPADIGGGVGTELNDIWGWTDPVTGKEWAIVGLTDGTSFVDMSDPINPVYTGKLPTHTVASPWRDIKVYEDHAFIVADNANSHGLQVFDLTQLRTVTNIPADFDETAHLSTFGSAHNIFIHEETGYAYVVGADQPCEGYLIVNIQDPTNPQYVNCYSDQIYVDGEWHDGYTHDVQCVTYNGPDTQYVGDEICLGCNEDALSIVKVNNKNNIIDIGEGHYNSFYTHQGWLTEDHRYFIQNDELDEMKENTTYTRTIIWDLLDLNNPVVATNFYSPTTAIDHNNYIVGDSVYQSNYTSGIRILDISDILNPVQIGYLDTYPGNNEPNFSGTWSNYPFFESRNIPVSSIEEGLFIVRFAAAENVAVDTEGMIPDGYSLGQNFPNPFNPTTEFDYTIPEDTRVNIAIYDLHGRRVLTLTSGTEHAGMHTVRWNGEDENGLPAGAGVYFYKMDTPKFSTSKKMILLR